jgi:hypothetical protein
MAALIERIYVHPEADVVTFETVVELVRQLAPSLASAVQRSELSQSPEAIFTPALLRFMNHPPAPSK